MISKELKSIYNRYALLDKGNIFSKMEDYERFIVYRHFRYMEFFNPDIETMLLDTINPIEAFCVDICTNNDMTYYEKKFNSLKVKISRYRKIIKELMSKYVNCYFVTLTYNDKHYRTEWSTKELRAQLSGFKKYRYIFNRDYGALNSRFHLHGLIFTNDNDIQFNWDYGFYSVEPVKEGSSEALIRYINKLSYHIFKVDTHYQNILNIK